MTVSKLTLNFGAGILGGGGCSFKIFCLTFAFLSLYLSKCYWIFFTYKIDLELHIDKCVLSHIVIRHVSVTIVTIIAVFYNKNTINTQIIIQKCMTKTLGVTLDILQGFLWL
jgi:hypothetical protein